MGSSSRTAYSVVRSLQSVRAPASAQDRQPHQVGPVRGAEARVDACEMVADGIRGQAHGATDVLVGVAERHVLDNLSLASREALIDAAQARRHAATRRVIELLVERVGDRDDGRDGTKQLGFDRGERVMSAHEEQDGMNPFTHHQVCDGQVREAGWLGPRATKSPPPRRSQGEDLGVRRDALPIDGVFSQGAELDGQAVPAGKRGSQDAEVQTTPGPGLEGNPRREGVQARGVTLDHITHDVENIRAPHGETGRSTRGDRDPK